MQRSSLYTILFATVICILCAIVVSSAAVSLKERQDVNATMYMQRNVLKAAGLLGEKEKISDEDVITRFDAIDSLVIDLETGGLVEDADPVLFDQRRASRDPATSSVAPDNRAGVKRLPQQALVYELRNDAGDLEMVVLPVEGSGLWSTLYGFIALDADLQTIQGLTFYEHGETPGLGGEVDNPNWKSKWKRRQAFGDDGLPAITVKKGYAGTPEEDPFQVDGLSGATLTARGVTNLLQFWLSAEGFGPYLARLAESDEAAERRAA